MVRHFQQLNIQSLHRYTQRLCFLIYVGSLFVVGMMGEGLILVEPCRPLNRQQKLTGSFLVTMEPEQVMHGTAIKIFLMIFGSLKQLKR
ncbi:hypothetical protein LH23_23410 [Cedecea neteri]|uniref:Uncharacterized protein n=1 Tax=Cedecea neteri TaxID=158822 RepID=A0AAN0VVV7_9ENTR|nr:hypothetical protein LH23_23410 [Cedecea neteri]